MEVKIITTLRIELTYEERIWLHNIMQNPLHGQDESSERKEDTKMREAFFQATKIEEGW